MKAASQRLRLRVITAAGLAVDAAIHLDLASNQPPGGPGQLDQSTLFYAEAIVAILAALAVLAIGSRFAYASGTVVAATALAAVLVSRYADIGSIGPLPDMYEPFWYSSKIVTTVAEAVALITAMAGFFAPRGANSRQGPP